MDIQVNPHELILIGENSFVRLSKDGGKTASVRCSHWRVLWTPAGAGHALFVDSPLTDGVRIYGDNVELVRFLQKEIEYLLYKPFAGADIPVIAATFERQDLPPQSASELVRSERDNVRLTWSDYLGPFNFAAPPGFDGRPIGVQATFFPAKAALLAVNDRRAEGEPWKLDRGGRPSTTACLAWCETWFRPR